MTDPVPPTPAETDFELDDRDPEAPELTDIDHPAADPGTDIVPPATEEEEEV